MEAKSDKPNASISYVYHKHDGTSSTGGACYKAVYHSHGSDCYSREWCDGDFASYSYVGERNGEPVYNYKDCNKCGTSLTRHTNDSHMVSVLECNLGGTIIGYSLICGKTEQTIESATIVFN